MRILLWMLLPFCLWGQQGYSVYQNEFTSYILNGDQQVTKVPSDYDSLQLWLEWDLGFTPSLWADQSGNGYDAKQPTAAAQPSLGADGIVFDSDWMRVGTVLTAGGYRFWDNESTIIVRFQFDAATAGSNTRIAVADSNSGGIRNWIFTKNTLDSLSWTTLPTAQTPVDGLIGGPNKAVFGQWQTAVLEYNGTTKFFYLDGSLRTSTPTGGIDSNDDPPIFVGSGPGGTLPFKGSISHVLIYSRALTDAERTALVQYVENN